MSASSPRISRYAREAELEMERSKPRVGLSQYTTSRLAELRARRAAQEDDLKSTTSLASGVTSSPGVTGELSGSSSSLGITGELSGVTSSPRVTGELSGRSSSHSAAVTSHSVTGKLSGRASSSIGPQDTSSRRTRQELVSSTENTSKPETNISPVIRSSPKKLPSDSIAPSAKSPTKTEVAENSLTRDQLRADQEVSQHRKQLENGSTQQTDLHQERQKISLSSKARDFTPLKTEVRGSEEGLVKSLSLRESIPQGDTERVKSLSLRESVPQGDTERVKSLSLRESVPQGDTERGTLMSDTADIVSRCKEYKATYSHTMDALAHLGRSNSKSLTDLEDDDSVGFSSLPEQVHRKALKRGFDFTLMVVGESGLGKSTLIQSLFLNTELYNDRKIGAVHERILKTVEIEKKYMEIEERGVKLRLTIVDTPGFNDSLCGEDSWKPVETYIDDQFEQYFKDESGLNRKNIKDNRVHCCLYFVSPFGHGLRPLDIYFMKRLHHKVNIVPIIAKADTLTHAEVRKMKASIMDQIENNDIQIYEFPDCDSDEDEEFKKQDLELKASIPFAVIGSNTIVEVGGKKIRGRLYPWGIVEVDNPDHCDFTKLRQMLISTHMQDLKDVTRDSHYENYRAKHISEQLNKQAQRDRNKLKRDSSPNFETIVATEQLLEQKDQEIRQMQEMLVKMQTHLKASQSPVSKPKMSGLGNL